MYIYWDVWNITKLLEEADELHDHVNFCKSLAHWNILNREDDADPNVRALRLEAREARQKADKLVRFTNDLEYLCIICTLLHFHFYTEWSDYFHQTAGALPHWKGPFWGRGAEAAYFGGTFIGNHVHTCCKVYNVKSDLTSKFHQSIFTSP